MLAARSSSCISAEATTKRQVSPLCYAEVYSVALSCLNLIMIAQLVRVFCKKQPEFGGRSSIYFYSYNSENWFTGQLRLLDFCAAIGFYVGQPHLV